MAKAKKVNYIYAIGRRKTSSARVRLHKGSEQHMVNDMPFGKYFTTEGDKETFLRALELTGMTGKYYVTVKVAGGGPKGQLGAVVLGIARALEKLNKDFRAVLKKAGLLTRDPREKERRKVGTGGKARRKKQSPKR